MMKEFYNHLINFNKIPAYYLPLIVSSLINALIWLVIIWRLPVQTAWIPLHYNIYFGIDWIGPWIQFFLYPLVGLIILAINFVINVKIYFKNRLLSLVINYSSLLIQIIILTSVITLIIKYFT
jgi:hypothetical protein